MGEADAVDRHDRRRSPCRCRGAPARPAAAAARSGRGPPPPRARRVRRRPCGRPPASGRPCVSCARWSTCRYAATPTPATTTATTIACSSEQLLREAPCGARGSPYEMYETVSTTTRGRILLRMAAASAPATAPASKRDRTHYLYLSVIAAVVLGIVVGLVAPAFGKAAQPLGTAFVALIKMMISPIIFCTIVLGIGSIRKAAQGRQGRRDRAGLLHGDVDGRAGDRPAGRQHHPARARACTSEAAARHGQVPAAKGERRGLPARGSSRPPCSPPLTGASVLQTLFVALLVGLRAAGDGPHGRAGAARHRLPAEAGVPGTGDDHVGWRRSARSARSRAWSAATGWARSARWPR